jgi:hypothetical protein
VASTNDDDVKDLVERAVAVVEDLSVPDDLREAAFVGALSLLSGGGRAQLVAGHESPSSSSARSPELRPAATGPNVLDAIASGLEASAADVQRLFADKDGTPQLIVKSSALPKAKSAGAHDIALLTMAARQLSGIDDYTDAEVLRDAAKRYGKFDVSNFGAHMRALDNYVLTDGKGASAKRKLTHPGIEAASALVARYSSEQ